MVTSKRDFGFLSTGTVAGLLAGVALSYVFLASAGNTEPVIQGPAFAPGPVELATLKTTYPEGLRVSLQIYPADQQDPAIWEHIFKDKNPLRGTHRNVSFSGPDKSVRYFEALEGTVGHQFGGLANLQDDQTANLVRLVNTREDVIKLVPKEYLEHGVSVIDCEKQANETNMQCSLTLK